MENKTNSKLTTKGLGKELGQSGTLIYHGTITQEEYNSKLASPITANKIYDTMRRSDATVRSTLQVCKLPLLSARWGVEPASDDDLDEYIARFCERELFGRNVDFHQFMKEGLTMFDFGFSLAEKTLELTEFEGQLRVGVKSLSFRKQRSIEKWETQDGKPGVTQQLIGDVVSIPVEKLLIFTNDKEGDNYEGISLLRYAYKHWDIKDKLDIVNAIALEKLAVGVPVLKKPLDADQADLVKARDALRNFRANEEGYQEIPVGWDLEMLDMKANSTKDVIPTIQYHDRQIQISVLAQFLSLGGSDASGSRAVSQDHSKLFLLSEEAAAKSIKSTIQEQLIKQLCDLNFSDMPNGYPQIVFSKIGDEDSAALAENVNKLMSAGAITYDPDMESHIREVLHLPDLPEEAKELYRKALENGESPVDKSSKKEELADTDEKKKDLKQSNKEIEASAIANAQSARSKLIDVLVG